MPQRRQNSRVRACTWLIFGTETLPSRISISVTGMRRSPSSIARPSPTGPPPTTSTGTSTSRSRLPSAMFRTTLLRDFLLPALSRARQPGASAARTHVVPVGLQTGRRPIGSDDDDLVAAVALGLVERGVGALQRFLEAALVGQDLGKADRGGEAQLALRRRDAQAGNGEAQPLGDRLGLGQRRHRQHGGELLAAQTAEQIFQPQRLQRRARGGGDGLVADVMAV